MAATRENTLPLDKHNTDAAASAHTSTAALKLAFKVFFLFLGSILNLKHLRHNAEYHKKSKYIKTIELVSNYLGVAYNVPVAQWQCIALAAQKVVN